MPDATPETPKRRIWTRKTEIGVGITILGEIMALIPVSAPFSPIVIKIGMLVAGVGVVHRNLKGQSG
jgi:hypothetical protein